MEKWKKNFQSKGKKNLDLLKSRHEAEVNALRQKIQLIINEK
jgi:ribosome biogenesis GTPase A